jgi:hypothetical protein
MMYGKKMMGEEAPEGLDLIAMKKKFMGDVKGFAKEGMGEKLKGLVKPALKVEIRTAGLGAKPTEENEGEEEVEPLESEGAEAEAEGMGGAGEDQVEALLAKIKENPELLKSILEG